MTSQLLINEPPLQVLPTLASIIGLNEAIVLQQIHYWLHPQFNKNYSAGRYWVYNTYGKWQKQFPFYSERTLRRTIKNLETGKFLISCNCGKLNQGKLYTINYESLQDICLNPQKVILKTIDQQPLTNEEDIELEESLDYPCLSSSEEDLSSLNRAVDAQYHQQDSHPTPPIWLETKENNEQYTSNPAKNNVIYPTWSNWPDHPANMSTPSGQTGHTIRPNWPPQLAKLTIPTGQIDHHTYTENTQENTTENILPPHPLSLAAARAKKEEEEEKIIVEPSSTPLTPMQPCEQMVQVWNQTVQIKLHPGKDVNLTFKRKKLLEELLESILNGKLESWQDYCALIAGSKFLMGHNPSGFKATLEWALVPDNAYKILEGAIYDKPEGIKNQSNNLSWEEFEGELAKTLPSSPYLLPWLKISISLAKLMGQEKYRFRFAKVSLKELTQTIATFAVESMVIRDSLVRNYSSELRCAVESVCPTVKHIEFEVCPPQGNNIHPLTTRGPK